jgi:hypothetical protein
MWGGKQIPSIKGENKVAKIAYKSVTLVTAAGDTHTFRNVTRVFHRADNGVTIMKGSNTPAEGRIANVVKVRTIRH